MVGLKNYNHRIHIALKELLEKKTHRDKVKFTTYQLAKAIGMPHSIIVKLIHSDPDKRVINPRIDTLIRIVDFFKKDGFRVTINDLLIGFKESSSIKADE